MRLAFPVLLLPFLLLPIRQPRPVPLQLLNLKVFLQQLLLQLGICRLRRQQLPLNACMRYGRVEHLSSLLALRRRELGVCVASERCSRSLELNDVPFSSSAAKESRLVAVDRDNKALYRLFRGVLNSSPFIYHSWPWSTTDVWNELEMGNNPLLKTT
jgi:hypothetical protein